MDKPNIPKDYADKHGLLSDNDWEYQNKESFSDLARYFLFIVVGAMIGALFMIGVLS